MCKQCKSNIYKASVLTKPDTTLHESRLQLFCTHKYLLANFLSGFHV